MIANCYIFSIPTVVSWIANALVVFRFNYLQLPGSLHRANYGSQHRTHKISIPQHQREAVWANQCFWNYNYLSSYSISATPKTCQITLASLCYTALSITQSEYLISKLDYLRKSLQSNSHNGKKTSYYSMWTKLKFHRHIHNFSSSLPWKIDLKLSHLYRNKNICLWKELTIFHIWARKTIIVKQIIPLKNQLFFKWIFLQIQYEC